MNPYEDYQRRKAKRLQCLGTDDPQCVICGITHWQCLELHHVEGQAYGNTLVVICRNCHRQLSDAQLEHPKQDAKGDRDLTRIARLLVGFADLLELVVAKLRETARTLLSNTNGPLEA